MIENKVAIIGSGFSGLTLAHILKSKGVAVEVFESRPSPGGLIQTSYQKVMVEAAAHALLSSYDVEKLFQELNIELVRAGHVSNAKWIFRDLPKKWPLTLKESLKAFGIPKKPKPEETVAQWADRVLSSTVNEYLLAPAFQGIYGAQTNELSASLVLGGIFNKSLRVKKGKIKGSVAPLNGMSELLHKLASENIMHYNSDETVESLKKNFSSVVVATGISEAAHLIQFLNQSLSEKLSQIPKVSLLSATLSFKGPSRRVQGFGCLFPLKEKFNSLGVLFNSDIFAKRGINSETWIMSGASEKDSSQIILKKILEDRKRLDPHDISVDFCEIHRWPEVLPLYGLKLEKLLGAWPEGHPFELGAVAAEKIYLTGNYLGGIGLAKILSYNHRLAARILKELK